MVQAQISGSAEAVESLHARLASHFVRTEPRRRVRACMEGLLGRAERKNGWHLAEAAGEQTPHGMQRLLASALAAQTLGAADIGEQVEVDLIR